MSTTRNPPMLGFAAMLVAWAPMAHAQSVGAKPIRMIVGFAPGGTNDILARILAQRMSESLGRPVIVDNRPGATGIIAAELVARAPPDGHTLMVGSAGLTVVPALRPNMPYDTATELPAVSLVGTSGILLVAHPSVPATSVKELIAVARSKPGRLSFATGGTASIQHLGGELFKLLAGVDMLHVPYKGNAPALTDVVSGQVDTMFAAAPPAIPLANAGRLRILAVSTAGRLPGLGQVPTIAESGVPGYDVSSWYGLFTSSGTPAEVSGRYAAEVKKAFEIPQVREHILAQGVEPAASTPAEFRKFVNDELVKWAKVIKAAKIRADGP